MTEYDDMGAPPNNEYRLIGGPPPESGWTYAVKPAWVHDLLDLWERDKLLALLLELAADRVAADIANPATRRRTLSQIARYFVPCAGTGRLRRTASPNVWVAYSQLFAAELLAPAYLLHIAAQNRMAQTVMALLHETYSQGDLVELGAVRNHLFGRFGARRTVRESAGALLRTLEQFGVLVRAGRLGDYRYAGRLPVSQDTFPLLVWAWRQANPVNVIDLKAFDADPLLTFIDPDSRVAHWPSYANSLWKLEVRDERRVAVLRHPDNAAFIRALFNLLSSHPKWPLVNRQFPDDHHE